jgi:transposase
MLYADASGPLTALAFVLIIGKAERFQCGKQIASYLGLVPLEESSGNRRRLSHITKQGCSLFSNAFKSTAPPYRTHAGGARTMMTAIEAAPASWPKKQ